MWASSLPNLSPDMTLKVNGTDWKKYGQIGKRGIFHDGIHEICPRFWQPNSGLTRQGKNNRDAAAVLADAGKHSIFAGPKVKGGPEHHPQIHHFQHGIHGILMFRLNL